MKLLLSSLLGGLILLGCSGCANGKKIQKETPVDLQQAYYTTWVGGTKGAGSGINLFIPREAANEQEVKLDSVYFRGKAAKLVTKPQNPNLFIGYFESEKNERQVKDFVMSADPKEEYGNRPPALLSDFPFELDRDEAMIRFTRNGEQGYFKITGIIQKDSEEVKIERPENIRH